MMSTNENGEIVVSIICCAYNHANYIRECLDGFISQKTEFPIEVLIHDDASTDNTAEIIREYETRYPKFIKPVYQQVNQYSQGVDIFFDILLPKAKGKYIAICEGDDYWTDPLKLQKQVDFLESHSDYGMIFGKVRRYIQVKRRFGSIFGSPVESVENLLRNNTVPTLTAVCRKELLLRYVMDIGNQQWLLGDYPLWLFIAIHSKIAFLDEILAVYRVLEESACHSKDYRKLESFNRSVFDMKSFFVHKYSIGNIRICEDDMNDAHMSYAMSFNKRTIAIEDYHKIHRFSFRLFLKYLLCKLYLLGIYRSYLKYILIE